jgi:hypothetical protein
LARSKLSLGGKTESNCDRIFDSAMAIGSVIVAGSAGGGAATGAERTGTGTSK